MDINDQHLVWVRSGQTTLSSRECKLESLTKCVITVAAAASRSVHTSGKTPNGDGFFFLLNDNWMCKLKIYCKMCTCGNTHRETHNKDTVQHVPSLCQICQSLISRTDTVMCVGNQRIYVTLIKLPQTMILPVHPITDSCCKRKALLTMS